MIKLNRIYFAAFLAVIGLHAAPAGAGSTAYLSRTGSGTTCSQAVPCSTMFLAVNAAGNGGEVICLDKSVYGPTNFIQSVTISCGDGLWEAPAATIDVNTSAGADVVVEGLVSDSEGSGGTTITFHGQGSLHLRRVRIGNAPGSGAHGLNFAPTGPATLNVSDSIFYNMGAGSTVSAGIYVKPASGVTANVAIERSLFEANNFGIVADGTAGGAIRGIVSDSFVTNNRNNGITVSTTSSSVVLTVDNTRVTGNAYGLVAAGGPNAGMLVGRSVINSNATGLYTTGGGALYSYRDNRVNGNFTTDGAFTGTVNLQ